MHMNNRMPTERSFGVSVGLVCIAAAALAGWRNRVVAAAVLAAVGAVLVTAGILRPAALRVANRIWWRFAQALGFVNSRILLTLFFFLVITPVGLVLRLFGRNPLKPSGAGTTWSPYSARFRDPRHYDHLF